MSVPHGYRCFGGLEEETERGPEVLGLVRGNSARYEYWRMK